MLKVSGLTSTLNISRLKPLHRAVLLVLLSAMIVVLMSIFRSDINSIGSWGYLAAFLITGVTTASIVLPSPGTAVVLLLAVDYNPFWLGIASGIGGTLGEITGYWLGATGRGTLEGKRIHGLVQWTMDHFGGWMIFLFALIPLLPIDIAGLVAGVTRYPLLKFLIIVGIGKITITILVMYAVAYSVGWVDPWLDWLT